MIYRAATTLDVDHLHDVDGVAIVVDEVSAENAMAEAIRSALTPEGGPHPH